MIRFRSRARRLKKKRKETKTSRRSLFLACFPTPSTSWVTRSRGELWLVPSNFPPYSNFRRGARAVVTDLLLSLYKPCQLALDWKCTFGGWSTEKCAETDYKAQRRAKWRKMKNLAVQCESCVEYLRGRVSSARPRSLRALSGEIHPRSKCNVSCNVCACVFK